MGNGDGLVYIGVVWLEIVYMVWTQNGDCNGGVMYIRTRT